MQVNPKQIVDTGVVIPCEFTQIQQVGIDLTLKHSVTLGHGCALNVEFNETIALPADMFATFHQRSSYSRKGIFVTTGVYDPGYKGSLGCTIYNMSGAEIYLNQNDRIGQLLVFKADPASSYNGQWQGK